MEIHFQIKMNEALYLRDPDNSVLGKKILKKSIELIYDLGFEAFTFKKLAKSIGTTEASIYRYFENKHTLLVYLTAWYWSWLEFQINYQTNNIKDPGTKLERIIRLLVCPAIEDIQASCLHQHLHQVIIAEGVKVCHTKQVKEDNERGFFRSYNALCNAIASVISECNPRYTFSKSLALTLIETAYVQNFFMNNLPSLTDFNENAKEEDLISFLSKMSFTHLKGHRSLTP